MKRKSFNRLTALVLASALVLSMNGMTTLASAAKAAKAKKIAFNKTSLTLKAGQSKKLKVKNKPAKAKLKWSTSNKKVATVKNGKVKAVKKGSAKITCKVAYKEKGKNKTKKLTAKVKVTAKAAASTSTKAPTAVPTTNAAVTTQAPQASASAPQTSAPAAESAAPANKEELLKMSNVGEEHKSANGITTKDNGLMRKELSSQDLMPAMGLGWNLGNQMEQSNCMGNWKTVKECETSAGNPVATQKTFDGLKAYGIKTVRVPVAWSNFMSTDGNYTINE